MESDFDLSQLYGNLITSRLHAERQDYKAALAALRRRPGWLFWPAVVTYHREEGRIAKWAARRAPSAPTSGTSAFATMSSPGLGPSCSGCGPSWRRSPLVRPTDPP